MAKDAWPESLGVNVGPDLNASRPETDEKVYKLLTLAANGLECVLVSDTVGASRGSDDDSDAESDTGSVADGEDDDASGAHGDDSQNDRDSDVSSSSSQDSGSVENGGDVGGRKRRAAVCVSVGVGSFYDPEECQGLAHFLEHMLFMGSKKYPDENAFDAFISRTGGESNAFTEGEQTTFHFTSKVTALAEALDIFAQFFVEPLMLEDAVDRELNAIESEFQLSKSSEACRVQEVACRTTRKGHPLSLFGWGNLRSLREDPQKNGVNPLRMLRELYDRHYVAPNLKLAICAPLPLAEIEKLVVEHCSCIRAGPKDFEPLNLSKHGFPFQAPTPEMKAANAEVSMETLQEERISLQCVHYIVPIRDMHHLRMTWQIPSQLSAYKSRPQEFLSHLIGHESEGSILMIAKERGWATSLMAGSGNDGYEANTACTQFPVHLTLTQKGMREWKQVVALVFEYIALLLAVGPRREVFDELSSLAEVDYRFLEESDPEEIVQELSSNMLHYRQMAREDLLTGPYLLREWKPEQIENVLSYLTPENLRVDLNSSYFGLDRDFKSTSSNEQPEDGEENDVEEGNHDCDSENYNEENYKDEAAEILDEDEVEAGGHNEQSEGEDENDDDKEEGVPAVNREDFEDNPALVEGLAPFKEPYFGTPYWIRLIDNDTLDSWNTVLKDTKTFATSQSPAKTQSGLRIPDPNPYVPKDLSLRTFPPEEALHPLVGSFVRVTVSPGWAYGFVQSFHAGKSEIEVAVEDDIDDELRRFVLDNNLANAWNSRPIPTNVIDVVNATTSKTHKLEIIAGGQSERGWQQLTSAAMRLFDMQNEESVAHRCPEFAHFYEPRLASCSTPLVQVHWLHSRVFASPKADISLAFVCGRDKAITESPLHVVAMDLFIGVIADELTNEAYMASMASLDYKVRKSDNGLLVRFAGFSDRIFTLVDIVLRHIFRALPSTDPEETAHRFSMRRESLLRMYRNSNYKTGHHAVALRLRTLKPKIYDPQALVRALDDPALQTVDGMFALVREKILREVLVDGLICGNVVEEDAVRLHKVVTERVKALPDVKALPRDKFPEQPVLRMEPGEALLVEQPCRDPNNANNSLEMYFQIGEDSLHRRIILDLIEQLMEEPIYDTLRTKYQLGYSVSCSMRFTHRVLGYVVRVTSDTHSDEELQAHVFAFLQSFYKFLKEELTQEHFDDALRTAVEIKLEEETSLGEESKRIWGAIDDHSFDWHATRREAFALFGISREEVVMCYEKWLLPTNVNSLRVISVRSLGPAFKPASPPHAPPPNVLDPAVLPKFKRVANLDDFHKDRQHYSLIPPRSSDVAPKL